MERALDEFDTNVLDLSGMSLDELRFSDDPIFARSRQRHSSRVMCSKTGVLQNQFREDI